MSYEHGGNLRWLAQASGKPEEDLLDFSANINPLGPPEWLRSLINSKLSSIIHYPDPESTSLRRSIADRYGVAEEEVLVGNGSSELIYLLPRVLNVKRAVIPVPSYYDYGHAAEMAGKPVEKFFLKEEEGFRLFPSFLTSKICGDELVIIGQPNNPTGLAVDTKTLRTFISDHPNTIFIVDEAFIQFTEGFESLIESRPPNLIVFQSFTKFYAIPGLRLGCVFAEKEIIRKVKETMPPWSVNSMAQAVGERALKDHAYAEKAKACMREERAFLSRGLDSFADFKVYPGAANFFLVRIGRKDMDARILARQLLSYGIAIRVCDNFDGLDERFFRIAVRTRAENIRLLAALKEALGVSRKPTRRKTPAIMFQGTSSNAGKSILTAALCRILLQDGYRVAPFKSQNMSLNSFVTREGGEMGRAQVVQAQACRVAPDVRMNPILLKPSSDTGCQVIVRGKPVGNMSVSQYIEYKPEAFEAAKEAFRSLAAEYDVLVLEGAGSPGEINLKDHDIANMKMSEYAGAPVLLVGDIDRGGVFASFIGTTEVLAEWERKLLAGFIINRFRGKEDLLAPAIEYTQDRTGLPFFGVIPYLHDLGLPEEDSVSFKSGDLDEAVPESNHVEIAVIDLPHISNFTDFDPFRIEPDVYLHTVRSLKDLGHPDAIILPGSKNVISDLRYLQQSGLAERIMALSSGGRTEVVGICGGFQFLGKKIDDSYGIESRKETADGFGLLPISTLLAREKTLVSVNGKHLPSGLRVRGYEIHHGRTEGTSLAPLVLRDDGEIIGAGTRDGLVWGTYLHGIFDGDEFRRWFIDRLRARRNLPPLAKVCAVYDLEPALNRLADVVRKSLKIEEIYKLMGLGGRTN